MRVEVVDGDARLAAALERVEAGDNRGDVKRVGVVKVEVCVQK
jgi:hypothetical protein